MSVRSKLLVIIGFVAMVPMSVLAYTILGTHRAAFEAKLSELHLRSAKYGAKIVESELEGAARSLKPLIVQSIRWSDLTDDEREGALWLAYGQLSSILSVELLDASARPIGQPARLEPDEGSDPDHQNRISARDLAQLRAAIDLQHDPKQELLHAEPVALRDSGFVALPLAFRVQGRSGPAFVVIGLRLNDVCTLLDRERLPGSAVFLLSAQGHNVCPSAHQPELAKQDTRLLEKLAAAPRDSVGRETLAGQRMLTAIATTPWQFRVVVAEPVRAAFASSTRMRQESLVWFGLGLLAALTAGFVLARSIDEPLKRLTSGAEKVANGDFSVRLPSEGRDELARLSASFNHMCVEIEKRQQEISRWNEELRARVEQKAAELKQAQHALLESRKIAAVTALGAGVAHEINNPLTGVIGLTQVLIGRLRRHPTMSAETDMLLSVEREALRVRDIVQRMLKLSQSHESADLCELRPSELMRDVLNARRIALTSAGIGLEETFASNLPSVFGHREQLSQVFEELIDNAIRAMKGRPAKLRVAIEVLDGEVVRMRVSDTGKGIAPEHLDKVFEPFFTTKDDWQGQGLGLTAAYRVIEAHHGTIELESRPGIGTTVTVALPVKRDGAHLA